MTAINSGMTPTGLEEIEIRGEQPAEVQYAFKKPELVPWTDISSFWGAETI